MSICLIDIESDHQEFEVTRVLSGSLQYLRMDLEEFLTKLWISSCSVKVVTVGYYTKTVFIKFEVSLFLPDSGPNMSPNPIVFYFTLER